MGELAFAGCQNNTIATIMDIPIHTLTRHFGKLLSKKRCERKFNLRKQQNKAAEAGVPAMLIFLGKNVLGQKDKQDITSDGESITPQIIVWGTPPKANDDAE